MVLVLVEAAVSFGICAENLHQTRILLPSIETLRLMRLALSNTLLPSDSGLLSNIR